MLWLATTKQFAFLALVIKKLDEQCVRPEGRVSMPHIQLVMDFLDRRGVPHGYRKD